MINELTIEEGVSVYRGSNNLDPDKRADGS